MAERAPFWDVNVQGTENVFKVGISKGARHLVLASPVSVYGSSGKRANCDETCECNPRSAFAKSKFEAEDISRKLIHGTQTRLEFQVLDGRFLVAIDGTEYLNSEEIHCKHCLERHHRDGRVEYYHQVLVAALIHPVTGQSFPLCAEEIRREDGTTMQDCESNAAARLLLDRSK